MELASCTVEDARAWARWWRIDGLREMRAILWEKWDPLALNGIAPDDEYDGYAQVLASKLKRGSDRSDIVAYLMTKLWEPSDLITPTWQVRCEDAADALIEWYSRSRAPR